MKKTLLLFLAFGISVAFAQIDKGEVDWNTRILGDVKKWREAAAKKRQEAEATRVAGTAPSHPLKSYVGRYEHPGYGIVEVCLPGEALTVSGLKGEIDKLAIQLEPQVDDIVFKRLTDTGDTDKTK
jgi:hypothetical protein